MQASLPQRAKMVQNLQGLLDQRMAGNVPRAKQAATNHAIPAGTWTAERTKACSDARDLATHGVELLMFPDASDQLRRSLLMQVLHDGEDATFTIESMSREVLEFLVEAIHTSKLRWATVDKKVCNHEHGSRLEHLLCNGVQTYMHNRNLADMFHAKACISSVSKTATQRLEN